jgi:hypothetical protein
MVKTEDILTIKPKMLFRLRSTTKPAMADL